MNYSEEPEQISIQAVMKVAVLLGAQANGEEDKVRWP